MEYKFYNSNTLKSVQVNEDTNLIFELTNTNNKKAFLNTLLYSSQYGCPISFSLIRKINDNQTNVFGKGTKLDFLYYLDYDNSNLVITHPTGFTEVFVFNGVSKTSTDGYYVTYYFYSSITNSYIKKITKNGNVEN